MKFSISLFLILFSSIAIAQTENPNFDAELAKKYVADDYGMKPYILVVLKTGTNTNQDKAFVNKCFSGHMANIGKLVADNKLIVAGPMGKNDNGMRGIFILDVPSIEKAKELLKDDPAISENLLLAEYYQWHGSAALPAYLETSDKIWKKAP